MISHDSLKIKKVYAGSTKVRKMYLGSDLVYSAGGVVTYHVDTGTTYTEEVDSDATCLSPTTFTPTKSGYTFVGWREDKTASSDVLSEKTMGDDSVSLYAVFEKTVTLTYYNGSSSASTETGTQYYNNGNTANPTFTLTPATVSGFTFSGWCTSSSATASVVYADISGAEFSSDTTLYAKYYQTITLIYYSTNSTAATETGTRYYNSGNYSNPTFTISSPSLSGWTFLGWIAGSTSATGTVSYSAISSTVFSADTTLYAKFSQTITLTYYSTSTTAATQTGTRYFNAYGNYSNPTFTISTPTLSGWTFLGWCTDTSATASVVYDSVDSTTFTASATIYGKFSQVITLSYSGNGSTSGSTDSQTGTRYFNAYGNYSNPSFTLASNGFTKSYYNFSKWAQGSTSGTQYSAGASVTLSASTTFYAIWTAVTMRVVVTISATEGTEIQKTITVAITIYTTATGSTVYKSMTDYQSSTSIPWAHSGGTYVTFYGILKFLRSVYTPADDDEGNTVASAISMQAAKTLYSNSSLSSTASVSVYLTAATLAEGAKTYTYYVPYTSLS